MNFLSVGLGFVHENKWKMEIESITDYRVRAAAEVLFYFGTDISHKHEFELETKLTLNLKITSIKWQTRYHSHSASVVCKANSSDSVIRNYILAYSRSGCVQNPFCGLWCYHSEWCSLLVKHEGQLENRTLRSFGLLACISPSFCLPSFGAHLSACLPNISNRTDFKVHHVRTIVLIM